MLLTRHRTPEGSRWALDGLVLPPGLTLSTLLALRRDTMLALLASVGLDQPATGDLLAPIEPMQEVWAAGVTYLRSREARRLESQAADVYDRVYAAERPELFFKALGWRVAGTGMPIRIRADSRWNVPEPELVLVVNAHREIVGYCAGNDVSSRDIEGENPLYLPQAKVYNGSCVLGQGIMLCQAGAMGDLPVRLQVQRAGAAVCRGETTTASMKRSLPSLVDYLARELDFPRGVFLMTGTGIVPDDAFTLRAGDVVRVQVGELSIGNKVGT